MDAKTLVTDAVSGKNSELANMLTDQLQRLCELDKEFTLMIEKANSENDKDDLNETIETSISDAQSGLVAAVDCLNKVLTFIVSLYIHDKYLNI